MVVNKTTQKLVALGFTEYEAKAYIALIEANPATAYEIAKLSGIPTSKIYEVIAKMSDKGLVSIFDTKGKKRYIPIEPSELIESQRNKLETTLDNLKDELTNRTKESTVSYIWNVNDYEYLVEKTVRMIQGAEEFLLISTWPEELSFFIGYLEEANNKGINISIVHFGDVKNPVGQIFQHPIEDTIYSEKGGRGFVLVVDSREALMATIYGDDTVEGAWSMNNGFIILAEDYIKHDVYIMKIVRRFDELLISKFGENYHKLRDIFNDEEEEK